MLASKVSRATQRVCPTISAIAAPGTHLVGSTTRGTHQRRRSSSKASCPPDSSNKPAPAAKAAATASTSLGDATSSSTSLRSKRTSKYRRPSQDKLLKRKEKDDASAYAALPTVPGVDHLDPKDLSFSSFFSLHRPLSLTNPFPPTVTEEAFAAIFESKVEQDPWANGNSAERRPEDVIYALSQTIETIEKASRNDVVHIDVLAESAANEESTTHLDGLPRARIPTLEEIVAQALPFQAPPPPQPFPSEQKQEKKRATRQSKQTSARTKSYTTTIVVTESRLPNGETTYAASASPIVRLPDPVAQTAVHANTAKSWLPYRKRRGEAIAPSHLARGHRYNIRNPRTQGRISHIPRTQKQTMLLISVKRQRKLKMKKHKYKKLMKRTRNLRRRLENK